MTAEPGTFPRRLVAQARRLGRKVALREKKYGIWQEVTWAVVRGAGPRDLPGPRPARARAR